MKKHIILTVTLILLLVIGVSATIYTTLKDKKQPEENNEIIENAATNVTVDEEIVTNLNKETRISIFYKDFRYSNSLVKLGTFESGIEKLANMNEEFTVKIEKVD